MDYNVALKSRLDAHELLLLEQEVKNQGKNMIVHNREVEGHVLKQIMNQKNVTVTRTSFTVKT